MFATGGIGWHHETGVQLVRLVLAGTFDRHPDLQLKRKRPLRDYFRTNVSYTPSGSFRQRYLKAAIDAVRT